MHNTHTKYRPFPAIDMPDRQWPSRTITQAPAWCSVDLRDGNQALIKPMNMEKKLKFFDFLVRTGFKEIEIGFPSASKVEFDFARRLIEENRIPEGVRVQVLVQAREHLIQKTRDALEGAKQVTVHLYNSTSEAQRRIVFGKDEASIIQIAVDGVRMVKEQFADFKGDVRLEYSPESFTGTELPFAADIVNAVIEAWGPTPDKKMIINLPSTVEMATPNVYADQIEWMIRRIKNRESVIVSLHAHNDRGCAVAATELALMAGADRVEGTLLGNGERTGNVDIVTLALNMHTQGIDSGLDFSDADALNGMVEYATEIPTHIRHPYVGKMVYTAFSGSHQDAINKGMAYRSKTDASVWEVPYLPIDPSDVGRTYEDLIQINSQSGKGGVAFILEQKFGYEIPKGMHAQVGAAVQKEADKRDTILTPEEIRSIFEAVFLSPPARIKAEKLRFDTDSDTDTTSMRTDIRIDDGEAHAFETSSKGPVAAMRTILQNATGKTFEIGDYHEHAFEKGADAQAVAYVGIMDAEGKTRYGAAMAHNIALASIKALIKAVEHLL